MTTRRLLKLNVDAAGAPKTDPTRPDTRDINMFGSLTYPLRSVTPNDSTRLS